MRTYFRALILGIAALVALTAAAQSPYTLIVQGTVAGCTPFQQVTVSTIGNTQPLVSHTLEIFPPNCFYDTVIDVFSPTAALMVSTLCGGVVLTEFDTVAFNFIGDTAVVTINLNCGGGGTVDCQGIPGGPNLPGTACNDGDPNTTNDTWTTACACVGTPPGGGSPIVVSGYVMPCNGISYPVHIFSDPGTVPFVDTVIATNPNCYYNFLFTPTNGSGGVAVEVSCDNGLTWMSDSMAYTVGVTDSLNMSFTCGGLITDCLGVPGGSSLPGTPCNDNDPNTINDTWTPLCQCAGTVQPCYAQMNVNVLGPWTVSFSSSSSGAAPLTWQWSMPDGSNTGTANPTYVFTAPGTYGACISINAGNGCTSFDCDTIYVDSTGYISTFPIYYDCLGVPNGSEVPGTPCDDNDPLTYYDTWDGTCACVGYTMQGQVLITGSIIPCPAPGTPVHIVSISTLPPVDTVIATGPNCDYSLLVDVITTTGWFIVETSCDSGLTSVFDSLGYSLSAGIDTLLIDVSCGGLLADCLGIPGGPDMPGTPCNDGDTLTVQDTWTPSCQCVGVVVNYYDCLQLVNGPNLPGTPCNDNNPATIGDTWDANCNCVGSVPQPCNADFWVLQAYTVDSVTNLPVPTPNELWIWNLSSGGTGAYTFLWNFGDGTSSTDPFPTHVYASGGPYILCLTINDSAGCTSTYCDSVSVDANGMYTGIMGAGNDRQNGFTINVRDPLATGITERPTVLREMALWPNPVQDLLNIALVSDLQGSVSVEVIDMSGRVVRSGRHVLGGGRTQFTVPTNDLAPGLHVLRISNGTSSINQRFVRTE